LLSDHHPAGHPPRQLTSVKDLIAVIEAFIDGWNDCYHPFTWTKTADELLPHCGAAQQLALPATGRHAS
jgi:hypothetical protein